ncbi:unnamed protein product [Boreogadus saida]
MASTVSSERSGSSQAARTRAPLAFSRTPARETTAALHRRRRPPHFCSVGIIFQRKTWLKRAGLGAGSLRGAVVSRLGGLGDVEPVHSNTMGLEMTSVQAMQSTHSDTRRNGALM